MIRLATVGTSAITQKFIAASKNTGRYILEACYSRDSERGQIFAETHGFAKAYSDLSLLAADKAVDAVYIGSPNVCHKEQCRLLLTGGKHVICEKPIFTSAEVLCDMKELADRMGVVLIEAIKPRFYAPGRQVLKEAVRQIGRISHARIDFAQRSSRYDVFVAGEPVNIFDMSLHAGGLMDLGIYCVYAAVDLLGVPKKVTAASPRLFGNGADYAGTVLLDYGSFDAVLSYSKIGNGQSGSEIVGDKGTVHIGKISQYLDSSLLLPDGQVRPLHGYFDPITTMEGEANRFADFIADPAATREDYADFHHLCLHVHRLMDDIKEKMGLVYPATV